MMQRIRTTQFTLVTLAVLLSSCSAPGTAKREGAAQPPSRAAWQPGEPIGASGATDEDALQGPILTVRDGLGSPATGARVWLVDRVLLRPDQAVIASRTTGDWVATSRRIAVEERTVDELGQVQFAHVPTGGFFVGAELDDEFSAAERIGPSLEPITLDLVARARYRVRVVDAKGRPAQQVPVTLGVEVGDEIQRLPSTAWTDSRGIATLYEPPSAAFLASGAVPPSADDYGRVAVARIPSRSRVRTAVQRQGAANLALPPTVPMTIRAQHRSFANEHWRGVLQVFRSADGTRSDETLAIELIEGVATLPHVETGVDLRVLAVLGEADHEDPSRYVGTISAAVDGAEDMDSPILCSLPLDRGALIRGRVIQEDGSPIAREPIDLFLVGEPATSWTVLTDADGAFVWLLPTTRRSLEGSKVGLRAGQRGAEEVGRASVDLVNPGDSFRAGDAVNLGDVTVR